jgi:hypothetical protein
MKPNFTLSLAASVALMSQVSAGDHAMAGGKDVVGKGPVPVAQAVEAGCSCFEANQFALSFFGAGAIFTSDSNDHGYDDAIGGGAAISYFMTENFGLEIGGTWLGTAGTLHSLTASGVYRAPVTSTVAPYAFAGGGILTDGETSGTWHAGAGIELCLGQSGPVCSSLFADARYSWSEHEHDHVLIRAGLKLTF